MSDRTFLKVNIMPSIKDNNEGTNSLSLKRSSEIDVLSNILRALRLYASSYFCIEFAEPWGLDEPETECGTFHVIISGNAQVTVPNQKKSIYLETGDIIVFPTGLAHQIGGGNTDEFLSGYRALDIIKCGKNPFESGDKASTILCGYFQYEKQTLLPLIRDMPDILHIKNQEKPDLNWINTLIESLVDESRSHKPGGDVVIDRLTEVFIIQMLRWHINNRQNVQGYFKALADDRLSRVLGLMHKHPEKDWTVECLGSAVCMSRTAFARHFSDIVGMSPLSYLRQWRMYTAYNILIDSKEPMHNVANKVGYKSEAAFGKAFKKVIGISPGQVRKNGDIGNSQFSLQ